MKAIRVVEASAIGADRSCLRRTVALALLFFVLLSMPQAQCQTVSLKIPDHLDPSPLHGAAGPTLLKLASDNHIPLGLVFDDKVLCAKQLLAGQSTAPTIQTLVETLNAQLPSYEFVWANGVLSGQPRASGNEVQSLLDYRVISFVPPAETHRDMAFALWTSMRAQLHPKEGTGFVGGVPPHEEQVAGFTSAQETIRQNLDHIVRLGGAGAWLITGSSAHNWQTVGGLPFEVYGYNDGSTVQDEVCRESSGPHPD